jgi:PBP1b-binding outer membrane lipoprotein LpoB
MLKLYVLPFILVFLFNGCAERGITVPNSYETPADMFVSTEKNLDDLHKTTKSVSPASSMVEPIEHTEKPDTSILDSVQNNIAGALVLVIAAVLVL